MSTLKFKLVTPIVNKEKMTLTAYLNAFPILFPNGKLFKDIDHYHKVHKMDEVHLSRIEPYLKDKEIVYECNRHELEPTKICMALEKEDNNGRYLEIEDISIERLIRSDVNTKNIKGFELFNMIKDYLNGTFKAVMTFLKH